MRFQTIKTHNAYIDMQGLLPQTQSISVYQRPQQIESINA